MYIVGVDLGGTEIKTGLVSKDKGIIKKVALPTEAHLGQEKVVENIVETIKMVSEGVENKIEAIGIGSPGSIDRDHGIVRYSPNLPFNNFELAHHISEKVKVPTFVENDANAFTLGEWYFGSAQGMKHFVALTLGTGIGGGVVSHGILITGRDGIGAELGHVIVDPDGPLCGCGSRGCIEAIASARNTARWAKEFSVKIPENKVVELAGGIDKIESKHVFEALKSGDYVAKLVVEKVTDALARAIANYVHIFNPELIVIGGGMSKAGNALIKPIEEKISLYIMPSFRGTFKILPSALVEDAGILGASAAAMYHTR
ncbi:glucokinase [Marinitoga sp. 1135]|uniref:Transcriptional regulator/sugar kinase n=1 Tax=Marinitoga piezophila (strain DSM 14283 / JCM 11233 / KA3) TaxID=443254 RepID=H2J2Y5_MARPK|nr:MULTISPECIES: ROK family protein [Marinitoga]AEX85676.1 transcriptional regulator/sugar kinase [Marinitoga piezophila KA3]APT76127.1 glucokinase [Marinitoga sp. 1137]NUU95882.1 glucokinase [Marinitoga sp. 1135]NUU97792.1 glucokinase [Marinitoga sp. 1138]